MLVTLIPLFDENLSVKAYSVFTRKKNFLLNPSLLGTGQNDGAVCIEGLEVIQSIGMESLSGDQELFISLNQISVFSDIENQCNVPCERIVLLIDKKILPQEMYLERLRILKTSGYKLAVRKLEVSDFETYREILKLMDYVLLDHKKINIDKARIYFSKLYPNIKLCAGNIQTQAIFEELSKEGGYRLYEGEFYRLPAGKGETEVSPLKMNYIELLNVVNGANFELADAADVIGRDTALVISLLKMVNHMTVNSGITSIRHAAAMLGQKELKKWINTAVAKELYTDKPGEITRLSLLRAKFAENLAPLFGIAVKSEELFLMGLFSVLDLIMERSMEEALETVRVSEEIRDALVKQKGILAPVFEFIIRYERADWQEVSRLMVLGEIHTEQVYDAYIQSLQWYKNLFL